MSWVHRHGRTPLGPLLATLVLGTVLAAGCSSDEPMGLVGYERTPTPNVAHLSLPAVEGDGTDSPYGLVGPEGGLLLVYFGYTSCPDICPTTLADVRSVYRRLDDNASRLRLAMVTIDPEVDTPEVIAHYVRSFVDDAVALRTIVDDDLRVVADAFGADYGKELIDDRTEVFHTASLYAVDSRGDLVITWPFGTTSEDMAADIGQLLGSVP